jgi:hypothetical protein
VRAHAQPFLEPGQAMRLLQEVGGADAVMADQAEQRRPVAQPVVLAQPAGFVVIDAKPAGHVLAHGDVQLAERRVAGVVKRVVQVEQPDRVLQRERIIVP